MWDQRSGCKEIGLKKRLPGARRAMPHTKKGGPRTALCQIRSFGDYIAKALSITSWVHAPSGSLEITGSEPPASSVSIVR